MKILIPLDGSSFAEAIIKIADRLAVENKAEVHLIKVVSYEGSHVTFAENYTPEGAARSYYDPFGVMHSRLVEGPEPAHPKVVETRDQALDQEIQNSKDYLSNFGRKLHAYEVKTKVIVGEHVAEEIQAYANTEDIDLIALATHGRTGLSHIFVGSVATELLKQSKIPLLLVRPRELNT